MDPASPRTSSTDAPEIGVAPHRRRNPLTGDWVLVSPQRTQRPWAGETTAPSQKNIPAHDPDCYLCAGSLRATNDRNPDYTGPYVFRNDYPAMRPDDVTSQPDGNPLLQQHSVRGEARVLCFSERHDQTLAHLNDDQLSAVVAMWCDQFRELSKTYAWVAIFENKGTMMGCSNPHPHGQIWASDHIPTLAVQEDTNQRAYYKTHSSPLLIDYMTSEIDLDERIVSKNDDWIVAVPWWAVWPFETLIIPRRAVTSMNQLTKREQASLATILGDLMRRYDTLFSTSFPYSMGWHGAPNADADAHHWQLHAHIFPPLLRSASIRKFMVGYELLGEAQRDLTAERAAHVLRDLNIYPSTNTTESYNYE